MKYLQLFITLFCLVSCSHTRVSDEISLRNVHEIIIMMGHSKEGYFLQTSLIQKKEDVDYIINLIQNNSTDTLKTDSETLKYDLAGNLSVDFVTIVIPTDGGNHYKLHLTTDEIDTIIRLARRNRIFIRSSADNNTY